MAVEAARLVIASVRSPSPAPYVERSHACNFFAQSWEGADYPSPTPTAARQLRAHGHGVGYLIDHDTPSAGSPGSAGFPFALTVRRNSENLPPTFGELA